MRKKLQEIWGKTDDVVLRYPMVLTMAFMAGVAAATAVDYETKYDAFYLIKLVIVSIFGISLMFGIKMLSQRIGKGFLFELFGVLFLVGYYFILPKTEKEFTDNYVFILFPTFILLHLFVSFIPYFGRNQEIKFWQYNKNLFINIVLTAIFTGVLVGGVMLAILAIDKLFDLHFKENIYPRTFFFLAIFGSSFIFLLFDDKGLPQLEKDDNYPQILKFFTQFVLIPLLIIYVVILYFYSTKILINWELPRGWVSYLILAYSVVGILALLLVHPLKAEASKSWVKIFSKVFYYTLAPLLVLLFVAINTRILEYGYTEPRYFVLLIALWLTSVVTYFIFFKVATIKFVPVSLFAFGLFAMIFPYFNAFSVAKRSQKNDMEKVLTENDLLKDGKIDFSKKVKSKVAEELASKAEFLYKRKDSDFVNSFLDEKEIAILSKIKKNGIYYDFGHTFRKMFTNQYYEKGEPQDALIADYEQVYLASKSLSFNIIGYSQFFRAKMNQINRFSLDGKTLEVVWNTPEQSEFSAKFNQKDLNLKQDFQNIFKKYPTAGNYDLNEITVTKVMDNYEFKFVFDALTHDNFSNGRTFVNGDVLVLVKKLN